VADGAEPPATFDFLGGARMHLAMRPKPEQLATGRRFAVRLTQEAFPVEPPRDNFALLSIVDVAGGLQARDERGALWTSADRRIFDDHAGTKATLAWTLALPDASEALDYVAAHLHPLQPWPQKTAARPFLILVNSVEGGVAACTPLARTARTDRFPRQWPDDVRVADDGFRTGDLVVCASFEEGLDGTGPIFMPHQHGIVARDVTPDDVGRLLPAFEEGGVEYAAFADYQHAFLVARESGRPSECVVLFGHPEERSAPVVLAWSGTEIAHLRHPRHPIRWSVENTFHAGQKPAGVWLFSNAEFQMAFDPEDFPDFHWDGEYSPATQGDLIRHGLEAAMVERFEKADVPQAHAT
jgi:hypothetical protein